MINKLGKQVMLLFNAIFYQKRILFVGKEVNTNEICGIVMATAYLVSPPFSELMERTFPYTNLTNLDFISIPG